MNITALKYRGDFYEIAYDPVSGSILGVLLIPAPGHCGEPLDFHDLPPQLQFKITDSVKSPTQEDEDS